MNRKILTVHQRFPPIFEKCNNISTLKQIHAYIIVNGLISVRRFIRELVYTTVMSLVGDTTEYAHKVFAQIPKPDLFMWNTMIRGSVENKNPLQGIQLYARMCNRSVKPDNFTFPFVLKACTKLSWVKTGFMIHGRVERLGFGSNAFVRNTLLSFHATCGDLEIASKLFDDLAKTDVVAWSALIVGYARRGDLSIARRLFDEMPVKDLVSWNVMITAYAKQGEMGRARKLFDEIPERDVVTWNTMITGYVQCGSKEQAVELFEEMSRIGEYPDEVTMLSLLSACADLRDLEYGQKINTKILEMSSGEISTLMANALVDMYAKCGSIEKALEVFQSIREKDVASWNSVICGLALHGHAEESINLFKEMRRTKICPNEITLSGVLAACRHAGKVDEGYEYFDLLRSKYKVQPTIKHFGIMVDMLGCVGREDNSLSKGLTQT
ncbi:hypothetical protein Lal_00034167 [Lupinus albus]|uniref:Putative tetratricopeptide-like helical domain-containing protein n=1 Tax=Lupinus albus TaxID=3870 RepID=A0A6A5PHR7_LUPAL|nr:putative tetratricopeptide-like helical domain-containing protein [Lupinus albus]KAF1896469.1 hypothetical protein Lal_00034167 [Lupinus albus]